MKKKEGVRSHELVCSRRYAVGSYCLLLTAYSLLLFILSTVAHAEERIITLEEASRLATAGYETVKLSEEDLYQAEEGINKAKSQILPSVTADANYTKYLDGSDVQLQNSSGYSLRITQPLYTGGKEWSLWRQAKKKIDSGLSGIGSAKEEVAINVARIYYSVLKSQKTVEIKDAALKRSLEQRKVANARLQVGDATKAVVLRSEAQVAGAETELSSAKKDLLVAKDKLARFLAVSEDFMVADPGIQPLVPAVNLDKLVSISLEKRQDYIRSKIDEDIAIEGIKYANGNFLPSLKLEGVYSKRDQEPRSAFFNEESVYGGITLTYPLFEGGLRKAELNEAKSKRRQSEFKRISLRKDIELEVREAFHSLEAFNSIIESFKRQVAFSEENYNMVFKQFQYGLSTNVDVIDANATLVSSQGGLSNAQYDYQLAILELKKRTGVILDDIK